MLAAFARLKLPLCGWEIVIVDNGSTDNTALIINSFTKYLPIKYFLENTPGKNNALNFGIKQVSGELVVLTDDDIIPHENWLIELLNCADTNPDYSIFAGKIMPYWSRQPEEWILKLVPQGIAFAITDQTLVEGEISASLVWGPNMAIRKSVFTAGFQFDSTIGPNGKNYIMGSETEFTVRLARSGYKSWFCSGAMVQHIIRENQLELNWIKGRAFRYGRGQYRKVNNQIKNNQLSLGIPLWVLRKLIFQIAIYLMALLQNDFNRIFTAAWDLKITLGYSYQAWLANK